MEFGVQSPGQVTIDGGAIVEYREDEGGDELGSQVNVSVE